MLTSAVSNVRQSQSPKQLRENLSKLNQELQNSKQRIVEAYNQDKARFGANAMPSINGFVGNYQNTNQTMQQPSNNYQEGMTATHPTTGQKLIFRGGQWQDM
ncbi:MAG: hypothetical protein BWY78_01446 [Alphaproteobacteria bacterium ADurb.Bin438]|nr:MAG: hypothetical protein BWY78_01446 [Alphaproteobacteria bacterium ADurb.Bin438]